MKYAASPATCGAAKEVPTLYARPVLRESAHEMPAIRVPALTAAGAQTVTSGPPCENSVAVPSVYTAPTTIKSARMPARRAGYLLTSGCLA